MMLSKRMTNIFCVGVTIAKYDTGQQFSIGGPSHQSGLPVVSILAIGPK
jgi:hypothetical protein